MKMHACTVSSHRVAIRFVETRTFADPAVAAAALELLTAAEREVLFRLRSAAARREFLAAWSLTRAALSEFAGGDARRLEFRVSSSGEPSLAGPPDLCNLRFSMSHSGGMAVCAVGERVDLGADVETLHSVGSDALALAELVASPRERHAILAASLSTRSERLLTLWAMKEALSKATGLGLRFPTRNVTVLAEGGAPLRSPIFDVTPPPGAPRWHLEARHLTHRHLAAVAVRCPPEDRVEFEFEEARVAVGARGE
jgi:4'-phosphopantetheinyl transferase